MTDLLRDDGFLLALVFALIGSGAIVLTHARGWFVGIEAGLVATLAAVLALAMTDRDTMLSLAGIVLLGIGAGVTRHRSWLARIAASTPGAVFVLLAVDSPVPNWAQVTLLLALVFMTPCVTATDATNARLVPLLLAITAFGMWSTTPDTEHTRVLVGALAGVAVLGLDRRLRSGALGTAMIVGLMSWSAVIDGYPRRGAVVGALACFGVAALLPLAAPRRRVTSIIPLVIVVAVQVGLVLVCARVAGLRGEAAPALGIAGLAWLAAWVVLSRAFARQHRA